MLPPQFPGLKIAIDWQAICRNFRSIIKLSKNIVAVNSRQIDILNLPILNAATRKLRPLQISPNQTALNQTSFS
ncbi:hypothetical protein E5S67_00356 [Microcoleus sp. IPMA8]|uniref:Uncharacterized protein n=1 Tax=Microcoleus asticus IPMA8 TaxID=2563858 RepID=A0ABX2CSV2_9CYAN|nr:hypothetical protein [Microcoleus asticus IPMA8]